MIRTLAILMLIALAMAVWVAAPAQGVGRARAQQTAEDFSAHRCPHHRAGVCLRHTSRIYGPFRVPYWGTAWTVWAEGWERSFFEPWMDWQHARWHYWACATIRPDGVLRRITC